MSDAAFAGVTGLPLPARRGAARLGGVGVDADEAVFIGTVAVPACSGALHRSRTPTPE